MKFASVYIIQELQMNFLKKIKSKIINKKHSLVNASVNFMINHFSRFAPSYLRTIGVLKGQNLLIKEHVFLEDYKKIYIGNGCGINSFTKFYTEGGGDSKIYIGNNVWIARGVIMDTGTHDIGLSNKRMGRTISKNIIIGDGCWIGLNVLILPGVEIGNGCIIQAGSVVTRKCKSNCIYGGNPAKCLVDLSRISALSK